MLFLEWGYIFYNLCSRAQENNSQKINFDTRSHKKYVENNIRISESLFFDEQISTQNFAITCDDTSHQPFKAEYH